MAQTTAPELLFDVELESLQRAFSYLHEITGQSMGSIVKQNTRLIAWNLAHNTQPWGMDKAAHITGKNAVARDVGKVFLSAQKLYGELLEEDKKLAKKWYKILKAGGYSQALRLLQDNSRNPNRNTPIIDQIDPALHQRYRNNRGRVNRHRAVAIIPDKKQIERYIKEVQEKVGFAKAGWITAGRQLGAIAKVPVWITKHRGQAPGHAEDQSQRKTNPFCTLTNEVRYISQIFGEGYAADALRIAREKMLTHIEKKTTEHLKAAGFTAVKSTAPAEPLPMAA